MLGNGTSLTSILFISMWQIESCFMYYAAIQLGDETKNLKIFQILNPTEKLEIELK